MTALSSVMSNTSDVKRVLPNSAVRRSASFCLRTLPNTRYPLQQDCADSVPNARGDAGHDYSSVGVLGQARILNCRLHTSSKLASQRRCSVIGDEPMSLVHFHVESCTTAVAYHCSSCGVPDVSQAACTRDTCYLRWLAHFSKAV